MKTNEGMCYGFVTAWVVSAVFLKLSGVLSWSWWWILLPLWIFPALIIVGTTIFWLAVVFTAFGVPAKITQNYWRKKNK